MNVVFFTSTTNINRSPKHMESVIDFSELIDAVGDAVIAADSSGAIVLWNPAAVRMFGYTREEAMGRSLDLITPQKHQKRHWDGYYKTMETGQTKYGHDVLRVPAVNKGGNALSIAFTVALLHSQDNKVSAIVAVIRDETDRFAEERHLRKRLTELESAGGKSAGTP
jgi:PAS domain S-box-containing protein